MSEFDKEAATRQAHAEWDRSEALRKEFSGKRESYVAFVIAEKSGVARILGQAQKKG